MNAFEIKLRHDVVNFVPGDTVAGTAAWQVDGMPSSAELHLLHHTSGKGTTDVEIVESLTFEAPTLHESRPFEFTLPDAPWSFSGRLVSLGWALELAIDPGHHTQRLDIIVSPTAAELDLYAYDDGKLPESVGQKMRRTLEEKLGKRK